MILGLFGYYPWNYGALDFLDLGLETLAYDWRPCDLI